MCNVNTVLAITISTLLLGGIDQTAGLQANQVKPEHVDFSITPEELLSRAIQSIGGRKALNQLESFQLHGVIRLADERPAVEIELATKQGGKVLGVMTYIGVGQSRFGSNGTTAWEQNLNENSELTWKIIGDKALSQKVQQMNWLEWFTMLPLQLQNMTVLGAEEFNDETCWKISLQEGDEKEQLIFFSTETYRPRGRRTVEITNNGNVTIDVYFQEWERVGNLLLFHKIVFDRDGTSVTLKLDRILLNEAKNQLFTLPTAVSQLRDSQ